MCIRDRLNTYAYTLMNQGKKAEGVKMFELNAKRHADDPNVHDSLGEGYMMNGQNAVSYTHLDVYKRQSLLCHAALAR